MRRFAAMHALMVQGTTSGAGKSTVVAGLCRVLARRGRRVAPFKPQNMSLNSAVAVDGGEIARAQQLQAQAARVPACTDMNPVLIKPTSDTRAQLIVCGQPFAELEARGYQELKPQLLAEVRAAFARLQASFDTVLVEGAGSPAEVNLRAGDIANMGFAESVDCAVLLVADIDRGGVFAHIVGTLACLSESERARIVGFVINRFRGDQSLLDPGLAWLESETGKPVLGVLPFLSGLALDAEDGFDDERMRSDRPQPTEPRLRVAVPVYPRISNHTDFDALRAHPQVEFEFVGPGRPLPPCELLILPGSKNVAADLAFLREAGWDEAISRHLRYGGKLIGVCGGMQMLGRAIHDPDGIEAAPGTVRGLGLLDLETTLAPGKQLRNVRGVLFPATPTSALLEGYEIHAGVSSGAALARPAASLDGRPDGAVSQDGQILATYVHGLFDHPAACAALLRWAGLSGARGIDRRALRETSLERLADCLEAHLALDRLQAYF